MKRKVYAVAVVLGAILFGAMVAGRPVTGQPAVTRPDAAVSVKSFGAKGDGSTDDTAALSAALNAIPAAGGTLSFPPGTYLVSSTLNLKSNVTIAGHGAGLTTIKASTASVASTVVRAGGLSNVTVRDLTVDANGAARAAAGNAASMHGLNLEATCSDCRLENVTVTGARGPAAGGTAVSFGVAGNRNVVSGCRAVSNGTTTAQADGFYTSGIRNVVVASVAEDCTDTGFVIELGQGCSIVGCTAKHCGAGGGISAIGGTDCVGNAINGLAILDPTDTVTGAMPIGCFGVSTTANLVNTTVTGVRITDTGGSGVGPAIYVQRTGTGITGRTVGLVLNDVVIQGHTGQAQGIALDYADRVTIGETVQIRGIPTPVQVAGTCTKVVVRAGILEAAGAGGMCVKVGDGAADVTIACDMLIGDGVNTTHGVYFFGTQTGAQVKAGVISGVTIAAIGSDAGTNPHSRYSVTGANKFSGFSFGKTPRSLYDDPDNSRLTTDSPLNVGGALSSTAGVSGTTGTFTGGLTVGSLAGFHDLSGASIVPAGANQANATAITTQYAVVTGADGTKGVRLPAPVAGRVVVVMNLDAANNLLVYPSAGTSITGLAADAALTVGFGPHGIMAIFAAGNTSGWQYGLLQ